MLNLLLLPQAESERLAAELARATADRAAELKEQYLAATKVQALMTKDDYERDRQLRDEMQKRAIESKANDAVQMQWQMRSDSGHSQREIA